MHLLLLSQSDQHLSFHDLRFQMDYLGYQLLLQALVEDLDHNPKFDTKKNGQDLSKQSYSRTKSIT